MRRRVIAGVTIAVALALVSSAALAMVAAATRPGFGPSTNTTTGSRSAG